MNVAGELQKVSIMKLFFFAFIILHKSELHFIIDLYIQAYRYAYKRYGFCSVTKPKAKTQSRNECRINNFSTIIQMINIYCKHFRSILKYKYYNGYSIVHAIGDKITQSDSSLCNSFIELMELNK